MGVTVSFIDENDVNSDRPPILRVYLNTHNSPSRFLVFSKKMARWLLGKYCICNMSGASYAGAKYFDGLGCLAAQFIKKFKNGVGDLYIIDNQFPTSDYNYVIAMDDIKWFGAPEDGYPADDVLTIGMTGVKHGSLFKGKPSELVKYINELAKTGDVKLYDYPTKLEVNNK